MAIAVPRSAEMVAAVLGVAKTGRRTCRLTPGIRLSGSVSCWPTRGPALIVCTTETAGVAGGAVRPVVLDDPATAAAIAACANRRPGCAAEVWRARRT